MKHLHKMKHYYLLFSFLSLFSIAGIAQNQGISYAYDNAGNRISRKIVDLSLPQTHIKRDSVAPAPVIDQLGERKITIYPNPTKGMLAVEITGGDDKDQLQISLYNTDGKQLQNRKVVSGSNSVNMATYPAGWYILRVQAGEKRTEFKIIKQ